MDRWAQTEDRLTNTWVDGHRQTHGQMDTDRTYGDTDIETRTERQIDTRTDGHTDRHTWTDRHSDIWTHGQTHG